MSAPTLPIDQATADAKQSSGPAIVFEDVHLSFEENEVLRGVSFQLSVGETKALFGVAGAGKSTILKLALELLLYDSPTGGLDPITSNTIIELIMKQRDVYRTSSLLVTHRLQDAFTLATHEFDPKTNQLKVLPRGQYCDVPMSFLVLRDGKVIFDGDVR